jgi:hypothetical protein
MATVAENKSWRDLTANTDILLRPAEREAFDTIEALVPVPESGDLEDWMMDARDLGAITEEEYRNLLTAIRRVVKK